MNQGYCIWYLWAQLLAKSKMGIKATFSTAMQCYYNLPSKRNFWFWPFHEFVLQKNSFLSKLLLYVLTPHFSSIDKDFSEEQGTFL